MAEEGWGVERDDPKKPFPLKIVDAKGDVIARVYGYSGKSPRARKRLASARAKAFVMMPAALRALQALAEAQPTGGAENREKFVQACVRTRSFVKHAGNLRAEDIVEENQMKEKDHGTAE